MKVLHTLICFFFLSLQDGTSGLINVFTGIEGGEVGVTCSFIIFRSRMYFCKGECKQQNVLIETTGPRAQRDRYSIEYEGRSPSGQYFVVVRISQLTKSDSGLYGCGLGRTLSPASYVEFEVIVVDALLDSSEVKTLHTRTGGNITVECSFTSSGNRKYFCKDACEEEDILVETTGPTVQRGRYSIRYIQESQAGGYLYVSITQLIKSDSGRYMCGLDERFSPDPYQSFEISVTDAQILAAFSTSVPSASTPTTTQSLTSLSAQQQPETPPATGVLLYLVAIPVTIVIIAGLALMMFCIRRNFKPDGLQTGGNSDGMNLEINLYENCSPASTCEDSTYQSLDPASMDPDQTYSTLTHTQHT